MNTITGSQIVNYAASLSPDALKPSLSQENSRHQLRLLENLTKYKGDIKKAGLKLKDLNRGVTISDYGKTQAAKELLLKPGEDSDLLISSLQGKSENKAAALIQKILRENGFSEKAALINPNLSTDEVREQFNSLPLLPGFYHELPGYLLLIKDYNNDLLSEKQFTNTFLTSLFHNGPDEGIWHFFCDSITGSDQNISLHKGTAFEGDEGQVVYPSPLTAGGVVHANFDRLDQGIDGLPKIAREISVFADLKDIVTNLLGSATPGTLKQLEKLKGRADELHGENRKLKFLPKLVQSSIDKLTRFGKFVKDGLMVSGPDGKQKISFKHPDGTTEILEQKGTDDYEHQITLKQPGNRQEMMDRNAAQMLSRIVKNFNEEDRYIQAA